LGVRRTAESVLQQPTLVRRISHPTGFGYADEQVGGKFSRGGLRVKNEGFDTRVNL
jgi:hypothetical protein